MYISRCTLASLKTSSSLLSADAFHRLPIKILATSELALRYRQGHGAKLQILSKLVNKSVGEIAGGHL